MTDAVFLQAIQDDPDDVAVRLVYADWLDENADDAGRDRAALIRAQCAAEKHRPRTRPRQILEREVKRLIKANPAWTDPITRNRLGRDLVFRRGFLHQVTLSATRFARSAVALFRAAPTLRAVRFHHAANEVHALAGCTHLKRLAEVDLSFMCTCGTCRVNDELREFVASPHIANLVSLNLSGDRVEPTTVVALVSSPHLGKLRRLDLATNRVGNGGARAILGSPLADRLEWLDLRGNDIGPRVAAELRDRFGERVGV